MTTAPSGVGPVGRLRSVNVGLPRDVRWRDRTVHTGIWKSPVHGPCAVGTLNLDGDGQGDLAGHGGPHRAVLVYQSGAYLHWARELSRDDLTPGAFGENLTVDGLPDDEVCIGDRYAVGSALFEVSQPRVTCYRVGMRLDEPRLPALLVSHHRPGFYLRVLREGVVQAGDVIERVAVGPERMTVAQVDALLYLSGRDPRDAERALRIDALSPGWRGSFEALVAQAAVPGSSGNAGLTDAARAPAPAWPGFRRLRVTERVTETPSVVSLRLGPGDGRPLPPPLPGPFVAVRLPGSDGAAVTRSYSLSGPPAAPDYRLGIKREPGGVAGALVHDSVRVGSDLDVAAPRGGFTLADDASPVLLLSAGIGVTPVLAMLHALAESPDGRRVWWVHAARNSREHAYADEARTLLARLPGARAATCYSRPLPEDREGTDFTHRGRPTASLLGSLGLAPGARAYVCGPPRFLDDMRAALAACGLDPGRVLSELFSPLPGVTPGIATGAPARRPHPPDGPPGAGPDVAFARSGLSAPWDPRYASLLELAEACDVPVRWSCRTGVCHTCEVGLTSGSVTYDPEPVEDPAAGNVLACSARPLGPVTLDL
jgi:ferredoxin-NADP reductase/MOSC domain-containing protein YiiM